MTRLRNARFASLLALLLALAMISAACGDDDSSPTDSVPAEEPAPEEPAPEEPTAEEPAPEEPAPEEPTAEEPAPEESGAPYGTLDFIGWEGYDTFFGANAGTLEELGIDFNSTYIGTPSDIASKFASGGGGGIDIVSWTTSNHRQFRSIEGILTPITVEEVPNLAGLSDLFADDHWGHFKDDDGNWLAIPFTFAPLGITYDSTRVSPTSYADLLDPELKGLIGIPDVPGLHVQAAAAALGYEARYLTEEQLDDVIEFMQGLWSQARVLSPSFGDIIGLLASGEIVAAYGGYPGLGAFTENPDILTVFPTEGTTGYVDVYSVPAGADNREGALAFINAMLDPVVNAKVNDVFAQATPIAAAVDLVSDANKALYPYDDLENFLTVNPIQELPVGENGAITMGDFIEAYGSLAAGG
jgi:spermidine/putrescine-binding protein